MLRWAPGARSKPQQSEQARSGDRGGDQWKVKPPLREEEQEEVTQEKRTSAARRARRAANFGVPVQLPGSYAYDLSTHFVARHPWAWDAPRVGLVPGLSLGCRLRVSCFLREDACVVRLCNGLCKMVYS